MKKAYALCCAALMLLCASAGLADGARSYFCNPDGGRYLHADPKCATISSAYWPIMTELSLAQLAAPSYKDLRLCASCCKETSNADAFFQGRKVVAGPFDVTRQASECFETYMSCCEGALGYLIDEIGEPLQEYRQLVEDGQGYMPWGHPDAEDISRDTAMAIAYAALETYIGIERQDMFYYYAEPWLDVSDDPYWKKQLGKTHSDHEWRVRLNRVVNSYPFYNAHGYYVYVHAKTGLITRIGRY